MEGFVKSTDSAAALERRYWVAKRLCCQVCHGPFGWRGKQTHHIIRGSGRSDEPCNRLCVCGDCHDRIHLWRRDGQTLSLGVCVTIKRRADPEEYDLARLIELYGQPIEPESLPEWLRELRRRNR